MTTTIATWLVRIIGAYLIVGACFALPFAARWVNRLDEVAAHGTPGFRLLVLPGAMLLWPVLLGAAAAGAGRMIRRLRRRHRWMVPVDRVGDPAAARLGDRRPAGARTMSAFYRRSTGTGRSTSTTACSRAWSSPTSDSLSASTLPGDPNATLETALIRALGTRRLAAAHDHPGDRPAGPARPSLPSAPLQPPPPRRHHVPARAGARDVHRHPVSRAGRREPVRQPAHRLGGPAARRQPFPSSCSASRRW